MLLYIENNTIKIILSKGLKQVLVIESNFTIASKEFHRINTKLWIPDHRVNYVLNLNDSLKTGGSQDVIESDSTELCSFEIFYAGTIPANHGIPIRLNHTNVVSICIQNLYINKQEMFVRDAIKVNDISECDSAGNLCDQKPCRNGGLCQSDGHQDWHCICLEGYKNTFCETSYCSHELCQNDGICILPDDRTYLCVCPHGWSGRNCESSEYFSYQLICVIF